MAQKRIDVSSRPISVISEEVGLDNHGSLPTILSRKRSNKLPTYRSTGFQPRPITLLQRISSIPARLTNRPKIQSSEIVQQQFHDLLNEPISEQHKRHFHKYFGGDISTKTFTINEFGRLFQVASTLSKRILVIFKLTDAAEENAISGEDVIRIARLLWISPTSVKAFILFKLFDGNDREKITIDDIRSFYEYYLSEFKLFKDQKRFNEVVEIFLQGFFPSDNEFDEQPDLDFDDFYQILQQNPSVFKSLYLISIPDQDKEEEEEISWFQRWWRYIKNNTHRIIWIILYILTTIALIIYVSIYRTVTIKNTSVWQVFARIGGMLVNFNYALAISLMLKQTMTIVRRIYFLRRFIPVDDHIDAHRFVGTVLFISAMIHSLGQIIHFATHLNGYSWFQLMFTTAANIGWVNSSANITGDILFVLLIIMFICSLQCIRQRAGCYLLFSYTHYLFWPIFILLVIHASEFWKWAIAPMTLLFIEKIHSLKRHIPKYGRTRLYKVRIEDDQVISLIIQRPENFRFHVGEYINICLPNIVRNEWHPFTICSSPEQKDTLRLTIMKKKNWTKKIYEHFSSQLKKKVNAVDLTEVIVDGVNTQPNLTSKNSLAISNEIKFDENQKDAVACIEGPFSTCTSYIFDCEHVVLIGGGVGITPYISALESLIHRLRDQRCTCFNCGTVNYKVTSQTLKKIDFIWVNRDIGNVSWFRNILEEFEAEQESYLNARSPSSTTMPQEQRSRYLDIHLYCTSIRSNEQAMLGNLPHDLIANMHEVMRNQDMHTQLRTPTHVGRPPWKLLFAKFKAEHPSTNVFFTGNRMMADKVKRHCNEYDFPFQHEPYF